MYSNNWLKQYGDVGFDDAIVFFRDNGAFFVISEIEFDSLGKTLWDLYKNKKLEYVKLLQVWNEDVAMGYYDKAPENPLKLDCADTRQALIKVRDLLLAEPEPESDKKDDLLDEWPALNIDDLNRLIDILAGDEPLYLAESHRGSGICSQ